MPKSETKTDVPATNEVALEEPNSQPEAVVNETPAKEEKPEVKAEAKVKEQPSKPSANKPAVVKSKPSKETSSKAVKSDPPASPAKKETPARAKKGAAAAKNGSRLPSEHQLENLKAAVVAAGGSENLLLILQHVEEAGGKADVEESVEAYRVLKTVLEE